jgi:nitrate/nitrite-specific signal transduction histidine kinase
MKKKIILASILFILITASSQFIFYLDIKRQSYDAKIVNTSGKQRMYSQQISKMALYTNDVNDLYKNYISLDSLTDIIDDFTQDNYYLKNVNNDNYKNPAIDSLFAKNQVYFKRIVKASNELIDAPNNQGIFENFITEINANEGDFLISMDILVNEYQKSSERKINGFKKILTLYSLVILAFLILILLFIIIPLYQKTKILDSE